MNPLKWFKRTPKVEGPKALLSIQVNLINDGNLEILYSCSDNTSSIAELTAAVIHQMNNGSLKNSFVEVLGDFGSTDLENKQFVEHILNRLELLDENEDEPLIQPIQTLRMYE